MRTDDYFKLLQVLMDYSAESKKEYFIHMWGHSWEIEEFSLWQKLEDMFSWISRHHAGAVCKYPAPYIG